jgi:hypothetical protein
MPISLHDSLRLLDTLDQVSSPPTVNEMALQLRCLAADQNVSPEVAQEVAERVLTHPPLPTADMWPRPKTKAEWEEAKQASDCAIKKAKFAQGLEGIWLAGLLPLGLAVGSWFWGIGGFFLSAIPTCMLTGFIYSCLYERSPEQKIQIAAKAQAAIDHATASRAALEPRVLTAKEAQEFAQVPGLARCVAQALDVEVPFLGLDWEQACARQATYAQALRQQAAQIIRSAALKSSPSSDTQVE